MGNVHQNGTVTVMYRVTAQDLQIDRKHLLTVCRNTEASVIV